MTLPAFRSSSSPTVILLTILAMAAVALLWGMVRLWLMWSRNRGKAALLKEPAGLPPPLIIGVGTPTSSARRGSGFYSPTRECRAECRCVVVLGTPPPPTAERVLESPLQSPRAMALPLARSMASV
eukprot:RCo039714